MKNFITVFLLIMSLGFSAYGIEHDGIEPDNNNNRLVVNSVKYIDSLTFDSKTLDLPAAGISEAEFKKLKLIVNSTDLNGEKRRIDCTFDEAHIAYSEGVKTPDTEFSFSFDMAHHFAKCDSMTDEDKAITQVRLASITDIRIDSGNIEEGINIGLANISITASFSDGSKSTFYRGRANVMLQKVQKSVLTYPKWGATCGGDAIYNGPADFPDSVWKVDGEDIETVSTKAVIFTPNDKQVLFKIKSQAGASSKDMLNLAFLEKDCSDDESEHRLFAVTNGEQEKTASFYTNAITDAEAFSGFKLYKIDSTNNDFRDDLEVATLFVSVWQNWKDDDGKRDHWENSIDNFKLDSTRVFKLKNTPEKWHEE